MEPPEADSGRSFHTHSRFRTLGNTRAYWNRLLLLGIGMFAAALTHVNFVRQWQGITGSASVMVAEPESKPRAPVSRSNIQQNYNTPPTCQQLGEAFGIDDIGAISAPHTWSSNLDLLLASSKLPEDPQFRLKPRTKWLLHKINDRLPQGIQHLPRDWGGLEAVLDKLVRRHQYLKMPQGSKRSKDPPPPPVTVLVLGGSVTMGINCYTTEGNIRTGRCAWAFRLESFLNQLAGFGDIYRREDDSTKLIKIINSSTGGLNSAVGQTLLRYEILEPAFDVIINAYATNDMHINTVNAAKQSGAESLGDYILSIQQDFVRVALSLDTLSQSCSRNSDQKHGKQPWVLFLNDYLGNEQRSIWATTEVGHSIDLLASHYGFGALSYPDMVRDWVYQNTTETNFSPALWYPHDKVGMRREIHHGDGFHTVAVFLVSYYVLVATTTYCSMFSSGNNNHTQSTHPRRGLPPRLTKYLTLETISEEWKMHDRLRLDSAAAVAAETTNSSLSASCATSATPRCPLTWMSGLSKGWESKQTTEAYFTPFVHQPLTTWTLVDYDTAKPKPGWSPPYDGLGQALVFEIPLTKRPVQSVALLIMKSYGEKWENSTALVEILQTSPEVNGGWIGVLGPRYLTGYHDKKTSETYTEVLALPRVAVPPAKLRINLSLEAGHTFKLMGLAVCDGGGDSSYLVPGSRLGFPPQCSIEQRESVARQLPARNCIEFEPWSQSCSFVKATTKGCFDPHWVRETYAQRSRSDVNDAKFRAVFVGQECNHIQQFADVLRVGTHDVEKYHPSTFGGTGCQNEVAYNFSRPPFEAEAVCIPRTTDVKELKAAKQAAAITDAELQILSVNGTETLDDALDRASMKDKAIHYLAIEGNPYEVISPGAAARTLSSVRYLEFAVGHQQQGLFEDLVLQQLVEHDLVCYWRGTDQNLWRITDCWFSHYAQKQWAYVACVSAAHADAQPLLQRMESVFSETLQKDLTFD